MSFSFLVAGGVFIFFFSAFMLILVRTVLVSHVPFPPLVLFRYNKCILNSAINFHQLRSQLLHAAALIRPELFSWLFSPNAVQRGSLVVVLFYLSTSRGTASETISAFSVFVTGSLASLVNELPRPPTLCCMCLSDNVTPLFRQQCQHLSIKADPPHRIARFLS